MEASPFPRLRRQVAMIDTPTRSQNFTFGMFVAGLLCDV
jgi:hypothetical protein